MICSTCARSLTLCKADSTNVLCQWSTPMQLKLALFNPPNQPPETSTPVRASTAWDDIDETSRRTALATQTAPIFAPAVPEKIGKREAVPHRERHGLVLYRRHRRCDLIQIATSVDLGIVSSAAWISAALI
jgi:hypothetical protein